MKELTPETISALRIIGFSTIGFLLGYLGHAHIIERIDIGITDNPELMRQMREKAKNSTHPPDRRGRFYAGLAGVAAGLLINSQIS